MGVESLMRDFYNGLALSSETTNDGSSLIHVVVNRFGNLPAVMAVVEEGIAVTDRTQEQHID